jgi:hypothetical protein
MLPTSPFTRPSQPYIMRLSYTVVS